MKKLELDGLKVDTFAMGAIAAVRGSVAAQAAGTVIGCPYSYGGTCVMTGCLPCYTDDPCN